jgi:hypothetical protein
MREVVHMIDAICKIPTSVILSSAISGNTLKLYSVLIYLTTEFDETQDKHLCYPKPFTEKELMKWTGISSRETISNSRSCLKYFGLIELSLAPSSKGGECYVYTVAEITTEIEERLSKENFDSGKVKREMNQMKSLVAKKKEMKRKEKEFDEF